MALRPQSGGLQPGGLRPNAGFGSGARGPGGPLPGPASPAPGRDEGEAKYNGGDAGGGAGGDPRPEDEERLPLENEWTFWYNKKIDKKNRSISTEQYERDLEIVGDVSSVQDFWCFFNNIRPPSSMGDMCCVSIFKNGIKPMWEDPINAKGGEWLMDFKPGRDTDPNLDQYWENLCMALVGETLDDLSEYLCGAVVRKRRGGFKMEIWISEGKDENKIMRIGRRVKEAIREGVRGPCSFEMKYVSHSNILASGGKDVSLRIQAHE